MTVEDATAPVAWRFEVGGMNKWAYSDGPMDPREVHDSGKRYEPLYTRPSAAPAPVEVAPGMPLTLALYQNAVDSYREAVNALARAGDTIERLAAEKAEAEVEKRNALFSLASANATAEAAERDAVKAVAHLGAVLLCGLRGETQRKAQAYLDAIAARALKDT